VASQAGFRLPDLPGRPRLFAGFDYASGDDGGGSLNTFNQLFPLGHAYHGYIDAVGRQNMVDFNQGVSVKAAGVAASAAHHVFWRAREEDALYHAGGGVVRPGAAGSDRHVGHEVDLTVKKPLGSRWLLLAGYSRFFAGAFLDETGPGEDVDFIYTSVQYTF
jgi:hypothetical protein